MGSSLQKGHTGRGFGIIRARHFSCDFVSRVVQESSICGDRPDPGSSFLWIGENHCLDRNEVRELVSSIQNWLERGRLVDDVKATAQKNK